MAFEFTVLERIVLQSVLPKQEDFVTFRIIRELRNELSFSEKEIKDLEIRQEGARIVWDNQKEKKKKIEIGERAHEIIVASLKELSEKKEINDENYSLYEKFVR